MRYYNYHGIKLLANLRNTNFWFYHYAYVCILASYCACIKTEIACVAWLAILGLTSNILQLSGMHVT